MSTIIYNEQQNRAIELMLEHEASPHIDFTLRGWAGTGKTTCLKEYIEKSRFGVIRICVSAPTHAAKEQISKATGVMGKTLQSLLGLRPNLDLADININNLKYQQIEKPSIDKYSVIIIDECSLIGDSLYYLLIHEAKQSNTKLIFVGDPLQLPPVEDSKNNNKINQKVSPTFLKNQNFYSLTKVMRQDENNYLSKLIESIRFELIKMINIPELQDLKEILPKEFVSSSQLLKEATLYQTINQNTHRIDYIGVQVCNRIEDYQAWIEKLFGNNKELPKTRYTAWENLKVDRFNRDVRDYIYHTPTFLNVGDTLMGYKTIIKEETEICINSKEYTIRKIEKIFNSDYNIYYYNCELHSINNGKWFVSFIKIVCPESYDIFIEHFNEKLKSAIENKRLFPKFYEFIEEYLLLETIKNTYSIPYSNKPTVIMKTFGFAYGSTVHKFQGKTVDYIFVNANNILKCYDALQRHQLLYVAISRAKKGCFIYL